MRKAPRASLRFEANLKNHGRNFYYSKRYIVLSYFLSNNHCARNKHVTRRTRAFPRSQEIKAFKAREKQSAAKIRSLEHALEVEKVKSSTSYARGAEGLIEIRGELEGARSRLAGLEEASDMYQDDST